MTEARFPGLSLEDYAVLKRLLRGAPVSDVPAILHTHGVTAESWERGRLHWAAELERDAAGGDGELLMRFAAACDAAPTATPSTARTPAALFTASEAMPAPLTPPAEAPRTPTALPSFMLRAQAAVAPPPRAAHSFEEDETVHGAGPTALAMPFAPTSAPQAPPPPPSAPHAVAPRIDSGTVGLESVVLTFEQYARIHAELRVSPERSMAIRERYLMERESRWAHAQAHWKERFTQDPALYAKWYELFQAQCVVAQQKKRP